MPPHPPQVVGAPASDSPASAATRIAFSPLNPCPRKSLPTTGASSPLRSGLAPTRIAFLPSSPTAMPPHSSLLTPRELVISSKTPRRPAHFRALQPSSNIREGVDQLNPPTVPSKAPRWTSELDVGPGEVERRANTAAPVMVKDDAKVGNDGNAGTAAGQKNKQEVIDNEAVAYSDTALARFQREQEERKARGELGHATRLWGKARPQSARDGSDMSALESGNASIITDLTQRQERLAHSIVLRGGSGGRRASRVSRHDKRMETAIQEERETRSVVREEIARRIEVKEKEAATLGMATQVPSGRPVMVELLKGHPVPFVPMFVMPNVIPPAASHHLPAGMRSVSGVQIQTLNAATEGNASSTAATETENVLKPDPASTTVSHSKSSRHRLSMISYLLGRATRSRSGTSESTTRVHSAPVRAPLTARNLAIVCETAPQSAIYEEFTRSPKLEPIEQREKVQTTHPSEAEQTEATTLGRFGLGDGRRTAYEGVATKTKAARALTPSIHPSEAAQTEDSTTRGFELGDGRRTAYEGVATKTKAARAVASVSSRNGASADTVPVLSPTGSDNGHHPLTRDNGSKHKASRSSEFDGDHDEDADSVAMSLRSSKQLNDGRTTILGSRRHGSEIHHAKVGEEDEDEDEDQGPVRRRTMPGL